MTIDRLNHLFASLPLTVAGFAAYCEIPADTLRDILKGRRSAKRGIKPELADKLNSGIERMEKKLHHIRLDE